MNFHQSSNCRFIFPAFAVLTVGLIADATAFAQGGVQTGSNEGAAQRGVDYGNLLLPLILMTLIGPIAVQFGTNAIMKFKPSFGAAFRANGVVTIIAILVGGLALFVAGGRGGLEAIWLSILAYVIIGTFVFGRKIITPDEASAAGTAALGYKRALLVAILSAGGIFVSLFIIFLIL